MQQTNKFNTLLSKGDEIEYATKRKEYKRGKSLLLWAIIGLVVIALSSWKVAETLDSSPTEQVRRIKQAYLVMMGIATIIALVAMGSGISIIKEYKKIH